MQSSEQRQWESILSVKKIDRMKTHWLNVQPKESVSIVGYTMLHVWIKMKCMYQIYGFVLLHAIMNQQAEVRVGEKENVNNGV